MKRMRNPAVALCTAILALSLTSCAGDGEPEAKKTSASPTVSTSATPTKTPQSSLTADGLVEVFTRSLFMPLRFETPSEMFASVYPGVTAAPDCLTVLGVGEIDNAKATFEFGPSNDRSLTALVSSSSKEDAAAYFETVSKSADACIADPKVAFRSKDLPVEITRTEVKVKDTKDSFGVELTGSLMGTPVSIIASVALLENEVILVAGWEGATNVTNVPIASDFFVKYLQEAHG